MKYIPPGLNAGLFLLACGIFCCVMFYLYDKKNNKTVVLIRENRKKGIYDLPYEDDPEPDMNKPLFQKAAAPANAAAAPSAENVSLIADELRKLKELKDEGVLTDEEFEEQKKKLLGK